VFVRHSRTLTVTDNSAYQQPFIIKQENNEWRIGLTENDGHENDGPSKLQDMKLQDMKKTDQIAGHENAGHENDGPSSMA